MKRKPWHLLTPVIRGQKRRSCVAIGCAAEVCEERILPSATAMVTAHPISNSGTSGGSSLTVAAATGTRPIVRDPSTGGPNGTTYLANDATTSANLSQIQATNFPSAGINLSTSVPAFTIGRISTAQAENLGELAVVNAPAPGNLTRSPQPEGLPSSPATGSLPGAGGMSGSGTESAGISSTGLNDILPLPELDVAFTLALDLTVLSGW
jgi:hypothetical protein